MSSNDCEAVDARIAFSIGTKEEGHGDGQFNGSRGLEFDHHRGLLLVVDCVNCRVQVFSCDAGGAFVSKFGHEADELNRPFGLAIDHDHDRIVIADTYEHRAQAWTLSDQSFLPHIANKGLRRVRMLFPEDVAIDKHHHRTIVLNTRGNQLVFLSSIDLSFLFSIGNYGSQPGDFQYPTGIAIDHDRHRIIVADAENHRVQVLSSIDGSFLFEFGSYGNQPGQFRLPRNVCIANQGRIIVVDMLNDRLQAFTHEGHHISSFEYGSQLAFGVAFDEHRGLIAFSAGNQVHVIGANQWLADTFTWRVDRHRYAPSWIKQAISTMTMIRSLVDESSSMSMIPNELLFEIFSFL